MILRRILVAATVLSMGAVAAPASGPDATRTRADKSFQKIVEAPLAEVRGRPAPKEPISVRSTPESAAAGFWDGFPGFPDRGRDGGWGRGLDCRGYDRGWEEHWGGHGGLGYSPREACEECMRRHGRCTYRCTVEAYRCWSEWESDNGSRQEYEGRTRRDRYEAEDDAIGRCRDQNWNNRDQGRCRVKRCESSDETVNSGGC